jgi:hypothetical protein
VSLRKRISRLLFLPLAVLAGPACASSFVTVGVPASTPSIITLGAPAVAKAEPASRVDPSLDPRQQALAEMKPGSWQVPATQTAEAYPPIPTPSIITLGEPAPAVTDEKVAAIPETKPTRFAEPMVIRGGIVGDAFGSGTPAAPAAEQPASPPVQQASQGLKKKPEAPTPEPEPETPQPMQLAPVPKPE